MSEKLRDLARDIATEAGDLARRRRAEGVRLAATKSTLADIVTEADREVEDLIRARLAAERPGDGFLGEESGHEAGTTDVTWVVDPIDGTVNYAAGIPSYSVSIAAVQGGSEFPGWQALAAVVYGPALGERFVASHGGGSFLEQETGSVRLAISRDFSAGALLATGFGYDPRTHAGDIETIQRVMPVARDVRRIGSAALDLAYVAAGRMDGFFERGLKPWDLAAGALLIEEAGGAVQLLPADDFGRQMLVAGDAQLIERIATRVRA